MEPKTLETKNHFGEFQEVNFVKDVYFSGGDYAHLLKPAKPFQDKFV
jgi:hypothetical protein